MKLIVLSPDKFESNEINNLLLMFEQGLELFHLRKPVSGIDEYEDYLNKIPSEFLNRIVIHYHYPLIEKFNLKGIHLNEISRKSGEADSHDYTSKIISSSFHDLSELKQCEDNYEYVFYSPVFKSISKPDYSPCTELNRIANQLKNIERNVVALGGISPLNIKEVCGLGFYGVATLGYIWQSSNPVGAFKEMKSVIGD